MKFTDWVQVRENWHGIYCGPGPALVPKSCDALRNGAPLPEPVDAIDAACKTHDIDYCKAGKDWRAALPFSTHRTAGTSSADNDFYHRVLLAFNSETLSPQARRFARLILAYFRPQNS